MDADGFIGAGVDGLACAGVDVQGADDVGDDHEDQFVVDGFVLLGAEEVFEAGSFAEAWGAGNGLCVGAFDEAGEDGDFAIFEADGLLGFFLADDGFCDAIDGLSVDVGGDLNGQLEGDVAILVDGGCHIDIDAYVDVLELGLDGGCAGAGGGGVGAGGDGDALADLEGGFLAIDGADAWVLDDASV